MKGKKLTRKSSNSESGAILLIVIILMLAVTITGLAFLNAGVMENSLVRREIHKNQAFYLAEAGLERTLWNLKQDFANDQNWTNGINGIEVDLPDSYNQNAYYELLPSLTLGDGGEYSTWLKYVFTSEEVDAEAEKDEIWIKSTGTFKNINKTVQTYVKIEVDSLWNNAISTGVGQGGKAIAGNVSVHGSVHILGDPEIDVAIDMTGTVGIRNNYEGMPDGSGGTVNLVAKIPPCPETTFVDPDTGYEETVQSLGATLRVNHGQVKLGGGATVGEVNISGNDFKETMDGVYVTDGFTQPDQVHSDNGTDNLYDLGGNVSFPSLTDPYPGYNDYLDYLDANSLPIPEAEISLNIEDFTYGVSGGNYIDWDQASGLLEINGIIYIEGGSLVLDNVEYRGKGTIVVAEKDELGNIGGEIRVNGNLLAKGIYEDGGGFPNNVLGLITNNLWLAAGPHEAMTGAFYAENQITNEKQTELAGTFISNYFDLVQVPKIYEVPALGNSLQTEMLNVGAPNWITTTSQWQES